MRHGRLAIIISASVAMALPATPAIAGGWGHGTSVSGGLGFGSGYRNHRRGWRHRDRVDAGDVIAGIAIIGAIAAIASSASRNRRDRQDRSDRPHADGPIASETEAVDACANAAEREAGDAASVRDILAVDRTRDGWDVEGTVEQRDDWRDQSGDRRRFTCSVRFGSVDAVFIDRGPIAVR